MAQLLDERDLGVLTSSLSLLVALVSNNHEAYWSCLPKCVKILERLARNQDIPQEYTYYGIPSPWLQVCIYICIIFLSFFSFFKMRFVEKFFATFNGVLHILQLSSNLFSILNIINIVYSSKFLLMLLFGYTG